MQLPVVIPIFFIILSFEVGIVLPLGLVAVKFVLFSFLVGLSAGRAMIHGVVFVVWVGDGSEGSSVGFKLVRLGSFVSSELLSLVLFMAATFPLALLF